MQGKILTGTASWTDPGFIADWYPEDLPAADRLRWYAEHFSLVEVNSTFYKVPEARIVRSWCRQTRPAFIFDIKLHRLLSRHSTPLKLLPPRLRANARERKGRVVLTPQLERAVVKAFLKGISPLEEEGKLGALLLQLSPAFSPRHNQLTELDLLLDLLIGKTVGVELRNGGWVTPERFAETKKFLEERKLAFVMVDGPADPHFTILPSIDLVTMPKLGYLRAHGRNAAGYIRERTVAGRFDYDYPKEELAQIAERAVKAAKRAEQVHVIYNNNKADYAPRAATTFQKLVREHYPKARPDEIPQRALVYE